MRGENARNRVYVWPPVHIVCTVGCRIFSLKSPRNTTVTDSPMIQSYVIQEKVRAVFHSAPVVDLSFFVLRRFAAGEVIEEDSMCAD
jgi:hypothetical protein